MTPDEFKAALKELGHRQKVFAEGTGMSPTTVSRWAKGLQPIPEWVAVLLFYMRQDRLLWKLVNASAGAFKALAEMTEPMDMNRLAKATVARLAASDTLRDDPLAIRPPAADTRRQSDAP